jgi:hypothetical protein
MHIDTHPYFSVRAERLSDQLTRSAPERYSLLAQ